jgi:16S rRNA (adenine1518-N6/adenine1519-N6)-dimethyltransferase
MKDEGGRMKKHFEEPPSGTSNPDQPASHPSSFILHPSTPKRRLGQNFLVDRGVAQRIVDAFYPQLDQTVIEIGPGRGALTTELIKRAGHVIAIEFDRDLAPRLRDRLAASANFKLIEADALAIDVCEAIRPAQTARVVANLPYNIGTAILQRLIEQRSCISDMTVMLQREVIDRIVAQPGSSDRGYLSVFVEAYCETEKLFDVSPQAFRPAPKVWSTVAHLRVRPKIAFDVKDENLLWQIVSAGFAHPRKTILNNLREAPESIQELLKKRGGASIVLCDAGIPPLRRAETFALEEWACISDQLL